MDQNAGPADQAQMLRLAEQLARQAAEIALDRIGHAVVSRKSDKSIVTTTDNEIQTHIVQAIVAAYPDHAICSEETAPAPDSRVAPESVPYCWVIDPLDGTRNYVASVPCFSTSIAVLHDGVPVVGVVYEHNTRKLFSATLGCGAFLNGAQIRVNDRGPDRENLLGVPTSKDNMAVRVAESWHATRGYVCRNFGSTAFELGLIACGAMSGMLGTRVKIWDIAAGALLVRQAGGIVTGPSGEPLIPFRMDRDPQENIPCLAAGASLHAALVDSIRAAMASLPQREREA